MIKFLRCVFVFLCVSFSHTAFAADYFWGNAQIGWVETSPANACQSVFGRGVSQGSIPPTWSYVRTEFGSDTIGYCYGKQGADQPSNWYFGSVNRTGDGCAAPKVYTVATKSCALPPEPVCTKDQKWVLVAALGKWPTNHRGCAVTLVKVLRCYKTISGPQCKFEVQYTGAKAGPDAPDIDPPPGTPQPDDGPRIPSPPLDSPPGTTSCPAGTVQMGQTASGTPICVATGTTPDNKPPPTKKIYPPHVFDNVYGDQVTRNISETTNADGSKTMTTTYETLTADGVRTITAESSTTSAIDGADGVQDGKDKGFCGENPTLSICRNSTVAGTCGAVTCTGDAIQCATLRANAAMECRQKDDIAKQEADPSLALGKSVISGNDPLRAAIEENKLGTTVDLSNPNLDSSGFVGSRSCIPNKTFAVMGRSVSVSFATVCDNITPLRYAIMAMCSLVGYLIVARSVLGN